jgi:hypothetical protein
MSRLVWSAFGRRETLDFHGVDLPEILLEIAARTEFTVKFTHVSERESRVGDLATSICAVLIAEACNIGLEPLVRNDVPALRRARLSWVNQNFYSK